MGSQEPDGGRSARSAIFRPPLTMLTVPRTGGGGQRGGRLAGCIVKYSQPSTAPPYPCAKAKRQSYSAIGLWTTTVAWLTGPAWSPRLAPGAGPPQSRPRRPFPSRVPPCGRSIGSWLVPTPQRIRVATVSGQTARTPGTGRTSERDAVHSPGRDVRAGRARPLATRRPASSCVRPRPPPRQSVLQNCHPG
jgi:hypothetical protein